MCNYDDVSTSELATQVKYNAAVLAAAPTAVLEMVRDDLLEAVILLVAAAEFVESEPGGARGPAITADEAVFLAVPRPSV